MLPLSPISSWLFPFLISRSLISGHAHVALRPPHTHYSGSDSTARINESIAGPLSETYDSFNVRSNSLTAASKKSSDIGVCPHDTIDDQLCGLTVADVDIYFWPDPSRDTSCLSIVGNAIKPPMQDASTRTIYGGWNNSMYTTVYWGCTARDSTAGSSFVTTAVLDVTGSLSAKHYLFNPWSSQPCSAEAMRSTSPISQPHEARGVKSSAHVRRHPLLAPSGITQTSDGFGATVTSGKSTLWVPYKI